MLRHGYRFALVVEDDATFVSGSKTISSCHGGGHVGKKGHKRRHSKKKAGTTDDDEGIQRAQLNGHVVVRCVVVVVLVIVSIAWARHLLDNNEFIVGGGTQPNTEPSQGGGARRDCYRDGHSGGA